MKAPDTPPDDSWESDPVWRLLDQTPAAAASPRFLENTLRAARLEPAPQAWWRLLLSPAPLAGLGVATAALAFALMPLNQAPVDSTVHHVAMDSPQAVAIEDIAETGALIAAGDQLDEFSDKELVSLIGF